MYCLRCGVETKNDQVFCENCLTNMERHPVKPGTPVKLPKRNDAPTAKQQGRRKKPTQEEQILRLKAQQRTLLALLGAALVLMSVFAFLYFNEVKNNKTDSDETASGTICNISQYIL